MFRLPPTRFEQTNDSLVRIARNDTCKVWTLIGTQILGLLHVRLKEVLRIGDTVPKPHELAYLIFYTLLHLYDMQTGNPITGTLANSEDP